MKKPELLGQDEAALATWLAAQGEPRYRARQVLDWLRKGVLDPAAMTNLPKALRARLAEQFVCDPLVLEARECAADGVRKYRFRLASGARIETVLIPERERSTVCVSSQAGCVYACPFCHTGTLGFRGNLTAAEILAQIAAVQRDLTRDPLPAPWRNEITHIVFMGMGEPLANLAHVLAAIRWLTAPWGLGISKRRITVSTVGLVPQLARLGDVGVNLAISLHAARDELRNELVPVNRSYPLARLRAALNAYPLAPKRHITLEYVLLAGINDRKADMEALVRFVRKGRERVNLIPFNPWPGAPYAPTPLARAHEIAAWLVAQGVRATVRRPRGQDILAACGQLAAKEAA